MPIKILDALFLRNGYTDLKIYTEMQRTRIGKTILKRRTTLEDSHVLISNFTTMQKKSRQCDTDIRVSGIEKTGKNSKIMVN